MLVYTDSETGNLGFVNITDLFSPQPARAIPVDDEPASVAVAGRYALATVNTSASFTVPSGRLVVVDIERRRVVTSFELGGQADSIAISPNRRFAAIVIKSEQDEEPGDGRPSQVPLGSLVIVDLKGKPDRWRLREVELTGIPDRFP